MLHLLLQVSDMELLPVACLCLLTWCGPTAADGNGPVITVVVEEGSDAILPCSLSTKENIETMVFDWKKDGRQEVFFYEAGKHYNHGRTGQDEQFKRRVFHFEEELKHGNASIKVTKTKMADIGTYSCTFPRRQTSYIKLIVGAAPKPFVTSLDQTKDWTLLQCEAHGDPLPTLEWRDSAGNILDAEEPQVTDRGGRSYITLRVTVTKTDNFSCVATQEKFKHQISAQIFVRLNGAAPEPYVTILDQTDDGVLLQCEVQGASPKPKVQWKDSAGNIVPAEEPQVSERGGSYDVKLQTTVTKSDRYRCEATQEEINHHTHAETYVTVNGIHYGSIVAAVLCTLLVGVVLLVVLVAKGVITLNCNRGSVSQTASNHSGPSPHPETEPVLHEQKDPI